MRASIRFRLWRFQAALSMGGIDLLTEAVLDDVLTARARLLSREGDPVDSMTMEISGGGKTMPLLLQSS